MFKNKKFLFVVLILFIVSISIVSANHLNDTFNDTTNDTSTIDTNKTIPYLDNTTSENINLLTEIYVYFYDSKTYEPIIPASVKIVDKYTCDVLAEGKLNKQGAIPVNNEPNSTHQCRAYITTGDKVYVTDFEISGKYGYETAYVNTNNTGSNYSIFVSPNVTIKEGEQTIINGTLMNKDKPVANTIVKVSTDDNKIESVTTDANGHFKYTYKGENPGTHDVTCFYITPESNKANHIESTCKVTVEKDPQYQMTVNPHLTVKVGEQAKINGTLMNKAKHVSDASIKVYVNDKYVDTVKTDANGCFNYNFNSKTPGSYDITFNYMTPEGKNINAHSGVKVLANDTNSTIPIEHSSVKEIGMKNTGNILFLSVLALITGGLIGIILRKEIN